LRDLHRFRGGRFGLDAEQTREVFPEDQIELIGIEARVFDDPSDLEPEQQCRVIRSQEKRWRPFYRTLNERFRGEVFLCGRVRFSFAVGLHP
jgi:hypothetical protein